MTKSKGWLVALVGIVCCTGMVLVDGLWQPGYMIKSGVKIGLFLFIPLALAKWTEFDIKSLFRIRKNGLGKAFLLGLGVYALIVSGFFVLRGMVDFSTITGSLSQSVGVTKANFLWVSLYISLVNSLLEEFFFRGFLYRSLKGSFGNLASCLFGALSFSLYHTAMMAGWFPWWLFLLVLVGLGVGGVMFTWLNRKEGTLYNSWLTHMFANFAINTVGFMLL